MDNSAMIQATIELFGIIVSIVLSIMFAMVTGNRKKSDKKMFFLLILAGVLLLFDAGRYVFNGNTSSGAGVMNRICCFAISVLNPVNIAFTNGYLCQLVRESGKKPNKVFILTIHGLIAVSVSFPLVNLFYRCIYSFGPHNMYERMPLWYLYTGVNLLAIILLIVITMVERKSIPRIHRYAIYIFLTAPFLGIAFQALNPKFSSVQLGNAIGCICISISYLIAWIQLDKNKEEVKKEKKKYLLIECVIIIMFLCVSASILSCAVSVNNVSRKNSQHDSTALVYMISETIDGSLSEPIDVSRTMSRSSEISDALMKDDLEGSKEEERMLAFMQKIKNEYGYQMVFAASEKTKAYYTYKGLSRYMDVDNDEKDVWYNNFKKRGLRYELNIDADKDNNMSLAVFVNMEVRDEEHNLIGICGVGMSIESLMKILDKYENDYSLNILIADRYGLIQIDTERALIKNVYIDSEGMNLLATNEISYKREGKTAKLLRRMDLPGWFLVIEDNNPDKIKVFGIILPSIIIYSAGIILLLIFTLLFGIHEKKRNKELNVTRKLSQTDGLTGLRNRYSMEMLLENIKKTGMPEDLSIVMIDINCLKVVNDTIGHDAGDELIKGAADCIAEVFEKTDNIFRIGGDEFLVVGRFNEHKLETSISELRMKTETWKGELVNDLFLSIGAAMHEKEPELSLSELIKKADSVMYKDKNDFYVRTGRDRRGSSHGNLIEKDNESVKAAVVE